MPSSPSSNMRRGKSDNPNQNDGMYDQRHRPSSTQQQQQQQQQQQSQQQRQYHQDLPYEEHHHQQHQHHHLHHPHHHHHVAAAAAVSRNRLFADEEHTSTSSSRHRHDRYRLHYRDSTYRSDDHHTSSSFRSPLLSKSASSKQKSNTSSSSTTTTGVGASSSSSGNNQPTTSTNVNTAAATTTSAQSTSSPARRSNDVDDSSNKVPSSPSSKTNIMETTSQIVAAANAGLSESHSKIDNDDPLPRRTLFSPSPNEKQQHQQQSSTTTKTPKSSHKGPLNSGLLDLHKSPQQPSAVDDGYPSPSRDTRLQQQQQQQHRSHHHSSRSSSSRSYHHPPPPPPYYQSSSSRYSSSSSSSMPSRHHSMSYGDYSPAVLPDQEYYDMMDRRRHHHHQQQHHPQDRYHHAMSEPTMLRSSRSFDRSRASGPDSDHRTTRRRHLMDYEDRYAYDTAATRGNDDAPPNTATTTASGNIPKPSPIYDRSSSTSSSRRPFSNITNIPPRTSIETGERNPVTSPEPIRTRYRGEDSSNTKPMDISTPSPKKSQTSANVSGSGGQQVSSAVAVSRRGGSKRKYDYHPGSSRSLSDEHSRSSSAMAVRYCTPIVTDRHRASVIPEEEQQGMSASSSSSHHRDSKKFRSTTPQLLRYGGAGGNTPGDIDHLPHSPHDLYEGHLTPHNYREQYLDDTPTAGSSMRHHRYSARKRMFHEESLSSPQRASSRNRDKTYGTPVMMHHGLESPGASAHLHRYPPHEQAAAQDVSTGSRSRGGYHQRKPSAIDSSYSYLEKDPPYSRYHSVQPHSAYSSRHSMGFSPYPLDKRPVRNSQLDSAITAAVLDQEQLSSINPEQEQLHRYSSYEQPGGELFKETKKGPSAKTTRRKKMYSDYVGVTYNKTHAKYQACITHYRKQHYLGRYKLAVDAARAYDESAKLLKGNGWKINFNSVEEYERAKAREIAILAKNNKNIDIEGLTNKDNSKLVTHATGHIQDSEYARALYAKARIEASTAKEKMNASESRAQQQDQQSDEDRVAVKTEDNLEGIIDNKSGSIDSIETKGKTAISDKKGKGGAVSLSPVASEKATTQSLLGGEQNPVSQQRIISKSDVHSISTSKSMNTPSSSNEKYRETDKEATESSTSDVMRSKFVSPSNFSSLSMETRKSESINSEDPALSTKAPTDHTKRKNIITPSTNKKSDSKPNKLSERDDIHSSDHDEDIVKSSSDEEEKASDEPLSKDKNNEEDDKSSDGNDGKKKGNGGTLAAASALISLVGN